MAGDGELRKLHDEGELEKDALHVMYPRGEHANYGRVKNLYTYFAILNRLLRVSITPRDGNPSEITKFQKNLMVALRPELWSLVLGISFGKRLSTFQRTPKRFAAIVLTSCI
jgi:hypothetical protein